MECPVCQENYDRGEHQPLVLLCGHSLCKLCAREIKTRNDTISCPIDRQIDRRPLNEISISYHILELIE